MKKQRLKDISLRIILGKEKVRDYVDEVARFRMSLFRQFPYLYDGTIDYEKLYLARYIESSDAAFVCVEFKGACVGFVTMIPLEDEMDEIRKPFEDLGRITSDYFYFGEFLLKERFHGNGIGSLMMEKAIEYVRSLRRYKYLTLCTVKRPLDHVLKPEEYNSLVPFWRKNNFIIDADVKCYLSWKDLDKDDEDLKEFCVWRRNLL